MLLDETSNKGQQMLEIEQKEIQEEKRGGKSLFSLEKSALIQDTSVTGKKHSALNSSF